MKIKELKEIISDMNDEMDVKVPSSLDADYTSDAKAAVEQYPSGEKYLLIHE